MEYHNAPDNVIMGMIQEMRGKMKMDPLDDPMDRADDIDDFTATMVMTQLGLDVSLNADVEWYFDVLRPMMQSAADRRGRA